MRRLLTAASLAFILGCGSVPAPAPAPPHPATTAASGVPLLHPGPRRLLLVMVDGLPVRLFDDELAAGRLPHLQHLMASRPTVRTTALSTFPSSTSPSVPEMLTGSYGGRGEVTAPRAVHAFDRESRRVVRYLTQPDAWNWPAPDLFDAAAAAHLSALTVFEGRWDGPRSILTRGSTLRDAALEVVGIEVYNGDRGPVERLLRQLRGGDPPRLTFLVFNAVDLNGHFHGPGSPETRRALEATDALLGRIFDTLAEIRGPEGRPLLETTTLLLFGDHGMVPSGTYLNLQPFFQRRGLSTFDASSLSQVLFRERLGTLWSRWPDVLLVSGGSNVTQVYLRDRSGGWEPGEPAAPARERKAAARPDTEVLAGELAELPGVAQVIRPLPGSTAVEVRASGGRLAHVLVRGQGTRARYAYTLPDGAAGDPLGYLDDPATAGLVCRGTEPGEGCFLPREAWQRRTAGSRYPGAVPLLPKALRPERFTGDLVVTAEPGWTFLRGQRGDHGNLEREAMTTPFVLNGPGVVPGPPPFVRLVDLYPTAAVLLGADPGDPALAALDGRPLPCVRPPETSTLAGSAAAGERRQVGPAGPGIAGGPGGR